MRLISTTATSTTMPARWPLYADAGAGVGDVRFTPESGHEASRSKEFAKCQKPNSKLRGSRALPSPGVGTEAVHLALRLGARRLLPLMPTARA